VSSGSVEAEHCTDENGKMSLNLKTTKKMELKQEQI